MQSHKWIGVVNERKISLNLTATEYEQIYDKRCKRNDFINSTECMKIFHAIKQK